jgi:hypothetical protein
MSGQPSPHGAVEVDVLIVGTAPTGLVLALRHRVERATEGSPTMEGNASRRSPTPESDAH